MTVLLLKIALKNIALNRIKTVVVGSIVTFGVFIFIVGGAFSDAATLNLRKMMVNSIIGDIQLYSASAQDKLHLFTSIESHLAHIGSVRNFPRIEEILRSNIPGIKHMIPMGIAYASVSLPNMVDLLLEKLERLYTTDQDNQTQKKEYILHLKDIAAEIATTLPQTTQGMIQDHSSFNKISEDLKIITTEKFWSDFDANPQAKIESLSNKLAPLYLEEDFLLMGFIGTLPERMTTALPHFKIIKGETLKNGERGALISEYYYEKLIKHPIARSMDEIDQNIRIKSLTIATNMNLQSIVQSNIERSHLILTELSPTAKKNLIPELQRELATTQDDLGSLVNKFLELTDSNFPSRYQFFFEKIAPHIRLRKFDIGDKVIIHGLTINGTMSSIAVKIQGVFRVEGFENSTYSGGYSILDITSFRDLYGFLTEDRILENRELNLEMGTQDYSKNELEELIFNDSTESHTGSKANKTTAANVPTPISALQGPKSNAETALLEGDFLNIAVMLSKEADLDTTLAKINRLLRANHLDVQAVDYREVSGTAGQLTQSISYIINGTVIVVFFIGCIMMMNSIMMSIISSTRELGTMRAIGASRLFIAKIITLEIALISTAATALGILAAALFIATLNGSNIYVAPGLPEIFFPSGKVELAISFSHILFVVFMVISTALLATIYPLWHAGKISPLEAMRTDES